MNHLYIMRHGIAATALIGLDRNRPLTPEGVTLVADRSRLLVEAHESILSVYHSPYVRTQQTADIVAQVLNIPKIALPSLEPSAQVDQLLADLIQVEMPTILISHLPLVDDLCNHLTGRSVGFHQGTIVKIELVNLFASSNKVASIFRG